MGTCVTTSVAPLPAVLTTTADEWGYEEHNGPSQWMKRFPAACGKKQSPIDITPDCVLRDSELRRKPLTWSYLPQNCKSLLNTGHGWKVNVESRGSTLSGGPLMDTYQLLQFHCHWGKNNDCGSEHTVNGKPYAGEIHLVHWNFEKYASPAEAAASSDQGLAVLGIFFEVGAPHPELQKLVEQTECIYHKGQECDLNNEVNPEAFIPENQSYWTYEGSLTTPPCSECVTWIVFKAPIQVSEQQLEAFRNLRCYDKDSDCPPGKFRGKLVENYRPPQPIEGRLVKEVDF